MAGRKQNEPEMCNVVIILTGRALDVVMYEKKRYDDNKKQINKHVIINRFITGARLNAAPYRHKRKQCKMTLKLSGHALAIIQATGNNKAGAVLAILNSI